MIQAEYEEMVFIQIIAPEVIFPTQKESAQSYTCSSRYLQNIETCAADAKEATIISILLLTTLRPLLPLILLQSISFVKDSSPTNSQRRSFGPSDYFLRWESITKHPSSKSFILRQFRTLKFPSFDALILAESEEIVCRRIVAPEVSFPTQKESA